MIKKNLCLWKTSSTVEKFIDCWEVIVSGKCPWLWRSFCLWKTFLIGEKSLFVEKLFYYGKRLYSWKTSLIMEKYLPVEDFFNRGKVFSCEKTFLDQSPENVVQKWIKNISQKSKMACYAIIINRKPSLQSVPY